VTPKSWQDVADTMEVSYCTAATSSSIDGTLTPSCTAETLPRSSQTTVSSPSDTGISFANFSPRLRQLVALLTLANVYDANSNIVVAIPATMQQPVNPPTFDPSPKATQ
jgi:hypothetical protein